MAKCGATVEVEGWQPRVVDEENIVVDVQTALYFNEGEKKSNVRVPNISFAVRTDLAEAVAISSETGVCEVKGLLIDNGSPDFADGKKPRIKIVASYGESKPALTEIEVDISGQVREILGIRREKREREIEQERQKNEEAQRKAVEAENQRLAHEMYEALAPERKRQIKAAITDAGRKIIEAQKFEIDPFNTFRKYADHPHTKDTALKVAKEAPRRFMHGVICKSASWAGEAMCIAAQLEPECAISEVGGFEDMAWAPDVLKIAAKRYPKGVINAFPLYGHNPWCRELMMHLAESAPQAVFECADMWEYYLSWARDIALLAASKAPGFAVKNYHLYKNQPWAEEIYKTAYRKVAYMDANSSAERAESQRLLKKEIEDSARAINNDNPQNGEHFAFLYEQRHHPRTKTVMMETVKRSRKVCVDAIAIYKSAPWARDLMMDAAADAKYGSEICLNAVGDYIEMPWAEDVMGVAAAHLPTKAIRLLPKYAAAGWAKSIILGISKKTPEKIVEGIDYIEYQIWAEEVVFELSKSISLDPKKMSALFANHQYQPWATSVRKKIEDEKTKAEKLVKENAEKEVAKRAKRDREFAEHERLAKIEAKKEARSRLKAKILSWLPFVAGGMIGLSGLAAYEYIKDSSKTAENEKVAREKADEEAVAAKKAEKKAANEAEKRAVAEAAAAAEAAQVAAEKKEAKFLQRWNPFQKDSKVFSALKRLDGRNSGLKIRGLDNVFLFRDSNDSYTLRLTCNDLDPAVFNLLLNASFPGIASKTTVVSGVSAIAFTFDASHGINSSIKEFIYLIEAFAQAKKGSFPDLLIPEDLKEVRYTVSSLNALSFGSFNKIFLEMAAVQGDGKYGSTFQIPHDPVFVRDILTFERVLRNSAGVLSNFAERVGRVEAERCFSGVSSVTELETLLKNFSKVEESYAVFGKRQINFTRSIVTEIAKTLTKANGGNIAESTPYRGSAVVGEEHELGDDKHSRKTYYPLLINNSGELSIGDFNEKTSEMEDIWDDVTSSDGVKERVSRGKKEVWGKWTRDRDPDIRKKNVESTTALIREWLGEACKNNSFIASCSLVEDESPLRYHIVSGGVKSADILFQYVLQNLEKQNRAYKILGVETYHIVVEYHPKGEASIVYKIYTLSPSALRADVVSVNGQPVKGDISSEPEYMSTVRGWARMDLEKLIDKKMSEALSETEVPKAKGSAEKDDGPEG